MHGLEESLGGSRFGQERYKAQVETLSAPVLTSTSIASALIPAPPSSPHHSHPKPPKTHKQCPAPLSSPPCDVPSVNTSFATRTMPPKITASSRRIPISNLSPARFAPFGQVVQNPAAHNGEPGLKTVEANQGTATKWLDVTDMHNGYAAAGRSREAKCVMNLFVCRPRELRERALFEVGVLERHPYTPQTFIPMGLSKEDKETAYLVVVAPTLPFEAWKGRPGEKTLSPHDYKGPPDLANLKAFIARGDQAVTYGAGTWHAPMVVLGKREIEFVVVQFANGFGEEDCQEVELGANDGGAGLEVDLASGGEGGGRAKL